LVERSSSLRLAAAASTADEKESKKSTDDGYCRNRSNHNASNLTP
jgi:hypothetical protein